MKCKACKMKAKCIGSHPVGDWTKFRYRLYKCPMCNGHWETLEIPATTCAYQAGLNMVVRAGRNHRNTFMAWQKSRRGK